MAERLSPLQFPQNQLESGLTPSAPRGELNISVSLGVVQNKCCTAYGAVLWWIQKWSRFNSSGGGTYITIASLSTRKTVAQCIQLCQENEETLYSLLVHCSGSSSSRKRTVYYRISMFPRLCMWGKPAGLLLLNSLGAFEIPSWCGVLAQWYMHSAPKIDMRQATLSPCKEERLRCRL